MTKGGIRVNEVIRLKQVSKQYVSRKTSVTALQPIDLTVHKGEIFGIIGHSGAGKSTLLRCINMLERPTTGSVYVNGTELMTLDNAGLQQARRSIGMIFQHFALLSTATVAENIAFPLQLAKKPKQEIDRKVDEMLALVGLSEHRHHYPAQLSGGQKQRVGIARALANDPSVLLCDEATSALDPQTTQQILQLLLKINRSLGLTIVLITHEMNVIRELCDRVAVIERGTIVEEGVVADVFLNPQHPTTKEFVEQTDGRAELLRPEELPEGGSSSMIRLTFIGEDTYRPILHDAVKQTDVSFVILQGTVSKLKDIPYGQLIVQLEGEESQVKLAIQKLQEHARVEVIGNA
nr:methionine ABC transporter ATP-binding protein [Paenibacillus turpanensis]